MANSDTFLLYEKEKELLKIKNQILEFCKTIPNDQKLGEVIRKYCLNEINK